MIPFVIILKRDCFILILFNLFVKLKNIHETAMVRLKKGRSQVGVMIRMMIERNLAENVAMTNQMVRTVRKRNVIIKRSRFPLTTMIALVTERYKFRGQIGLVGIKHSWEAFLLPMCKLSNLFPHVFIDLLKF